MEIPPKLKTYIDQNRGWLPPVSDPDEPLQIDSLGLVRLVAFLESELGYQVEDEELTAENFATLRKLGQLVASKTPSLPTGQVIVAARKEGGVLSGQTPNGLNANPTLTNGE
jgi:acyl carrier protein